MSKKVKGILSVVLALIMISLCSISVFAAAKTKTKTVKYPVYVNLGDSIANGYGMDGYHNRYPNKQGYTREVKNSYPSLVKTSIKAKTYYQCAYSGFRSTEMREVLDPTYKGDALSESRLSYLMNSKTSAKAIKLLRPAIQKAIKKADLITVDIGSNDTMHPMWVVLFQIAEGTNAPLIDDTAEKQFMAKLNQLGSMPAMINYIFNALSKINITAGQLKAINDCNNKSYEEFKVNYDAILKKVYALNPDATVVVVGMYNSFRDMKLSSALPINIGWIAGITTQKFNQYMSSESPYASKTIYADITDTEVRGTRNLDEMSITKASEIQMINDAHPTAKGQKYIAKQILKVLP